jgi:hypothetical protein
MYKLHNREVLHMLFFEVCNNALVKGTGPYAKGSRRRAVRRFMRGVYSALAIFRWSS